MLKKYLLTAILFSTPLFSMEPEKMSTQILKQELARYKMILISEKQTPKNILVEVLSRGGGEALFQEEMRRYESRLQKFTGIVAQYESELAKRSDR
jgi:hypothetical protein